MKTKTKQKIWFGIGILILSVICIILGVHMFKSIPNTDYQTPKETVLALGGIFTCILGGGGIIGILIMLGMSIFDE